jgi:histidine ammonia-lyase
MNGTAVMTALACLAWRRADYLTRLCSRLTALASIAMRGNRGHFDPHLFAAKPHVGQNESAAWIYGDLCGNDDETIRLQDRYSIRCAPHVIGVARDALTWMRRDIENELNSANDNPLIDGEAELLMHGGHFYGGHIAFAMDALKTAVANLADLMDRQLALLVDSKYNHGLPQNLSGASGPRAAINHGFKAVQIGASAWTAEALKLTMPASVFSRSTECHNQDKVSMGTISARDCLRVLTLTEQVASALCMAAIQGVKLRQELPDTAPAQLTGDVDGFVHSLENISPFLAEDRMLEGELRQIAALIRNEHWTLYPNA